MSKNVKREVGAANYQAGTIELRPVVVMMDDEGFCSVIQECRSHDSAEKAADVWQRRENAAIKKANKAAECAR